MPGLHSYDLTEYFLKTLNTHKDLLKLSIFDKWKSDRKFKYPVYYWGQVY